LQNDISQKKCRRLKRQHFLRRTRKSISTSYLTKDANQKVKLPIDPRANISQKSHHRFPRNRKVGKTLNRIVKDKANDRGKDVRRENVNINLLRKNYLIAQKAEYMRFANQINTMVANSK
jgi:hypothetical protein